MSVRIKYKGAEIASASTDTTKTIKTSGKYCEGDIEVINTQDGGITPSGSIEITENDTYDVTEYAEAVVNVPRSVDSSLLAKTYQITVVSDASSIMFDVGITDFNENNILTLFAIAENHETFDNMVAQGFSRMRSPESLLQKRTSLYIKVNGDYDYYTNGVSILVVNGVITVSNTRGVVFKAGTVFKVYVVVNYDWS